MITLLQVGFRIQEGMNSLQHQNWSSMNHIITYIFLNISFFLYSLTNRNEEVLKGNCVCSNLLNLMSGILLRIRAGAARRSLLKYFYPPPDNTVTSENCLGRYSLRKELFKTVIWFSKKMTI